MVRLLDLFDDNAVDPNCFLAMGWRLGEETSNTAARVAFQIASYRFTRKNEDWPELLVWSILMNSKIFRLHHHDTMTSHFWKTLAQAFRAKHPERDMEMLQSLFSRHFESEQSDPSSGILEVIVEITRADSTASWPVVADMLEHSEGSWTLAHWLVH
jgi:hypothetical protein